MLWKAVFTNDRAGGLTYEFTFEARNEDHAKMQAGMARATSYVTYFYKDFYKPQIVRWQRISLERIE